jgi:hypothetical protein
VTDDTVNQIARRVAIHQAVDEIVDARRRLYEDGTADALHAALGHLSAVALDDPLTTEGAWREVAAIAQDQLENGMERRAR